MNILRKSLVTTFILGLLVLFTPAAGAAGDEPTPMSAFQVLDRVHAAYDRLEVYSDEGSIERLDRGPDGIQASRFAFRTWKLAGQGFRFDIDHLTTVWRDSDGIHQFDRRTREVRDHPDLAAALPADSEIDNAALLVPRLLAGDRAALSEPEAASLSEPEACGDSSCWILDLTADGEAVHYRLWIDTGTFLIRNVKLERFSPREIITLAMDGDVATPASTFRVNHHIAAIGDPEDTDGELAAAVRFQPPLGTKRIVKRRSRPASAADGIPDPSAIGAGEYGFGESISVQLSSLSLRVVDSHGRSISDLEPGDFLLRVGGETVPVESVDWISSAASPFTAVSPADLSVAGIVLPAPGKLVVIFVQSDLHPSRAWGQLKMLQQIPGVLETFHRDDQVAVVSFDSHLKLHLDFTRDTSLVKDAVFEGIRGAADSWPRSVRYPALARHLDERQARRAATPERALELTALAMAPFSNEEKVVLFLGWGLGRYGAFGISETHAFKKAELALRQAGIPLFVLDISEADYHSLEVGLKDMAHATGGAYLKTYLFPEQAATRVAASLEGHYRIFYAPPESAGGKARIKIRLSNRKGTVLFSP